MPNPYLTDEVSQLTSSHKQAMQQMQNAAKIQGDNGIRAVQLWQELVQLLTVDEATEAGQIVLTNASGMWAQSKNWEAQSLDALAASLGVTRQTLLDELAQVPPTF